MMMHVEPIASMVKLKIIMLKSSSCYCRDIYILVEVTISASNTEAAGNPDNRGKVICNAWLHLLIA